MIAVFVGVAKRRGLGPVPYETGLFAADDDYRVPDIVVSRPVNRSHRGVDGTAELVVELRSPGDESYEKLPWYAARGVSEMLIVDPGDAPVRAVPQPRRPAADRRSRRGRRPTLDTLGVRLLTVASPATAHACASPPTRRATDC